MAFGGENKKRKGIAKKGEAIRERKRIGKEKLKTIKYMQTRTKIKAKVVLRRTVLVNIGISSK
jgi:hypothetical protein